MATDIDREGSFRGRITGYSLYEADSGAVGINLNVAIDEAWNPDTNGWDDWRQYEVVASGYVWVVKKDKTLNQAQVEALSQHAGWDGDLFSITNGTWQPTPCGFSIKADEYKGEKQFRVSFLNGYDSAPGGGNVSADKAKALANQYGSQFRAIAGSVKAAAKPAGKPPVPPSKPPAGPTKGQVAEANKAFQEAAGADGVPFAWLLPLAIACGSLLC